MDERVYAYSHYSHDEAADRGRTQEVACRVRAVPIVGAIAIKAGSVYQFYEYDAGRAAVVLVSEVLTAVTTELTRTGSIGYSLTTALASAVSVHSKFLQASKKPVLKDLPI